MAILIAMAAVTDTAVDRPHHADGEPMHWIVIAHIVFMAFHLAATVVAAAGAGLYLIADRQLKSASASAFKLPNLPLLERVCERGLVASTALLMGGLATGGAAMQWYEHFNLLEPTVLLSLIDMAVLIVALALRAANQIGRRGVASAALVCLLITACALFSQVVVHHG
jgi:ABC-type uncharacterized transport system permease subunit